MVNSGSSESEAGSRVGSTGLGSGWETGFGITLEASLLVSLLDGSLLVSIFDGFLASSRGLNLGASTLNSSGSSGGRSSRFFLGILNLPKLCLSPDLSVLDLSASILAVASVGFEVS